MKKLRTAKMREEKSSATVRYSALRAAAALLIAALLALPSAAAGKKSLVALGDSITYGYGLTNRNSEAYPVLVARYYGMRLKNYAVNGYTAADIKELLETNAGVSAAVKSADVICVTAGGNELLGALFDTVQTKMPAGVSLDSASVFQFLSSFIRTIEENSAKLNEACRKAVEVFSESFPALISEIRTNNPSALIVTQTLYNPFLAMPAVISANLADYAVYFDGINRIIHSTPADLIVETDAAFAKAPGRYINAAVYDIHPTKAGHRAIAGLMIRGLSAFSPYDRVYRINVQAGFRKSFRISCEIN